MIRVRFKISVSLRSNRFGIVMLNVNVTDSCPTTLKN